MYPGTRMEKPEMLRLFRTSNPVCRTAKTQDLISVIEQVVNTRCPMVIYRRGDTFVLCLAKEVQATGLKGAHHAKEDGKSS